MESLLLWAKYSKKETDKNKPNWHPLIYHMIDAAMVAKILWDEVLQPPVKERICRGLNISLSDADYWIPFVNGSHDIGKAGPDFVGLWDDRADIFRKSGYYFPENDHSKRLHHGIATGMILCDLLPEYGFDRVFANNIAIILAGHHGVIPNFKDINKQSDNYHRLGVLEDTKWRALFHDLFKTFLSILGPPPPIFPKFNSENESLLTILAGLIAVADWIASNTTYFPYAGNVQNIKEYTKYAESQAQKAIYQLGWHTWSEKEIIPFSTMFDLMQPNQMQKTAISLSPDLRGPSLIVIEAPMGLGKTEAALWLEDYLFCSQKTAGCYFALPTTATSNQMFGRFKKFLLTRFSDERVNYHLAHGHAELSDEYQKIKPAYVYNKDDLFEQNTVIAEDWFTPKKRVLLAPFAVGTVDQVLLSVLRVKHGFVRLFGLSGKVVIVDEVHAYDTYMITLLERLLAWLAVLGTSVILLSATLPNDRRQRLFKAYSGRLDSLPEKQYPRITWFSGDRVGCYEIPPSRFKPLHLECLPVQPGNKHETAYIEMVARKLLGKLQSGGCAAWICNTVALAQKVYQCLQRIRDTEKIDFDLDLFHAQFPYRQRVDIENAVLRKYGKEVPRDRPRRRSILVATQVVEQSLDLDFDIMVTYLAPVDLVLQRSGRLQRHKRKRPSGLRKRLLWVIGPTPGDEEEVLKLKVYDKYHLWRSWLFLQKTSSIADSQGIDELVQQVYNSETPLHELADESIRSRLDEAREKVENTNKQRSFKARYRLILGPEQEDLLDSFNAEFEEDNPEIHQAFQALTRLGLSLQCIFLFKTEKGLTINASETVEIIDLNQEPNKEQIKTLLDNAINISHGGVIDILLEKPLIEANGWKKSALLSRSYPITLDQKKCLIDKYCLTLDQELGLLISEEGE